MPQPNGKESPLTDELHVTGPWYPPHRPRGPLMKYLPMVCLGVIAFAAVPAPVRAQVESGPAANSKVEPLKVAVATGDDAGKNVDFADRRKKETTVFIFVQADKWDRPLARFLKVLDQELGKDRADVHVV